MIQLRLLGSTDLRGPDDQALLSILSQPKRLTLLAYLALNATDGFTRRDKLVSLFWPESDTDRARGSLRRSLSYLRKSLGEGVLVTRGDEEVGIAGGVLECDAVIFEEAIARGDPASAWDVYEGTLLDGVHVGGAAGIERWLDEERDRFQRLAVEAARSLADQSESSGDLATTLEWTREALALEPLSESWGRRLIGLLGRTGDREAAVRSYESLVARMADELDLEPSAETQALIASIRSAPAQPGGAGAIAATTAWTDRVPATAPAVAVTSPSAPTPMRSMGRSRALAAATVSLAAVTLIAVLWGSRRPSPSEAVRRYSIVMAEGEEMADRAGRRFAVSPDGSRVVYTGGPEGRLQVRLHDQLHARALPGTRGSTTPFFSPDGERVGFFAGGQLNVVSLGGGPIVHLTGVVDPVGGATWGADGFLYAESVGFGGLVRLLPRAGAVPRAFTTVDYEAGESEHSWPDALPNGAGVLFTVARGRLGVVGSTFCIAVADPDTGEHKILVEGIFARHAGSGHLIYVTTDSVLMVAPFDSQTLEITGAATAVSPNQRVGFRRSVDVSVSDNGTLMYATGQAPTARELAWVTRDGTATALDPAWRGDIANPTLSPDGSRLAVTLGGAQTSDIWIRDMDVGAQHKLTMEGGVNGYPAWTPGGGSVTYFSITSGLAELRTKPAGGGAPSILQLSRPRDIAESLWSPDGRWLIYRTTNVPQQSTTDAEGRVNGAADIFAIQPGQNTEPIPLAATEFEELSPALSPDGRWLAYSSNETGRSEIYVRPFPNSDGARWPVSPDGGNEPTWSHGTDELYYRDSRGNLVAAEVRTTPTFSVGRSSVLFDARRYFSNGLHPSYAVAPDDQRFLMLRDVGARAPGELIVVENWFRELGRSPRNR